MAGKRSNKKRQQNKKKTTRQRRMAPSRQRGSTVSRSRPQARPSAGTIIANGVRNLISFLPNSTYLSPAADFIFTLLGIGKSEQVTSSSDVKLLAHITGGQAAFVVSYVNIIASSDVGVRIPSGEGGNLRNYIRLDYTEARLISLSISLAPTNKLQSRAGTVTLGFWPFISADAEDTWKSQFHAGDQYLTEILEQNVNRLPYVVIGQSGKTLTLVYRPRVHDGQLFQFRPVKSQLGGVFIKFTDYARSQYDQFNGDELGFNCVVQGVVELRNSTLRGSALIEIRDEIVDNQTLDHTCLRLTENVNLGTHSLAAGHCVKISQSSVKSCQPQGAGCIMHVDLSKLNVSNVSTDFEMLHV